MKKILTLSAEIPEALLGKRLDVIAASLFSTYSRGSLQDWIEKGFVKVDGETIQKMATKIRKPALMTIEAELIEQTAWLPEAILLNIVYEDEAVIVLNKPAGLVTHPAVGHLAGTLVNALLNHCPELAQLPRCGIIHRLDKDTTGLMVVPKTLEAHHFLVDALHEREIERHYQALVYGSMIAGGTVDAPIGRHPNNRLRMCVIGSGKPAVTHFRVHKKYKDFTLLNLKLETGRTHQIRVHMAHIHHPLVGDAPYGGRLKLPKQANPGLIDQLTQFKRQALHATKLVFTHPSTQESMTFTADLPSDFQALLEGLNNDPTQSYLS